jgi:putative salt-induced outer membrane protein
VPGKELSMSTNRISQICIGLALSAAATPALAEWTGKGDIGASFASGNTENEVATANLELKNTVDKWQHTVGFAGNYGSQDGDKTAQRWEVRGQTQYAITDRAYGFGAARYENDEFSQYDYQSSLAGGLGYKFIDTERTKFWVQGGPGYRYAKIRETNESEDGVIFRGDLGFEQQLTETTKIVDRFLVEAGSDNTYLQNDLGLEVTISGALGLRVGYQVRHNTDVEPAVENTDTLVTVGLLYETK